MVEMLWDTSNSKGTRHGGPISVYLFLIIFEVIFLYIKENKIIKDINIFHNEFLYWANAEDTTFS